MNTTKAAARAPRKSTPAQIAERAERIEHLYRVARNDDLPVATRLGAEKILQEHYNLDTNYGIAQRQYRTNRYQNQLREEEYKRMWGN